MIYRIAIALLLCISSFSFAEEATTKPATPRFSADGVEFPAFTGEENREPIPLLADLVGGPPESIGGKVYSWQKTSSHFLKNVPEALRRDDKPEWFAYKVYGAKAAGLWLGEDGEIKRLTLYFDPAQKNIVEQFEAKSVKNSRHSQSATHRTGSIETGEFVVRYYADLTYSRTDTLVQRITFSRDVAPVDVIEKALSENDWPDDIEQAIRQRKLLLGMTLEQAKLVYHGHKGQVSQESSDGFTYEWEIKRGSQIDWVWATFDSSGKVVQIDRS